MIREHRHICGGALMSPPAEAPPAVVDEPSPPLAPDAACCCGHVVEEAQVVEEEQDPTVVVVQLGRATASGVGDALTSVAVVVWLLGGPLLGGWLLGDGTVRLHGEPAWLAEGLTLASVAGEGALLMSTSAELCCGKLSPGFFSGF